MSNSVRASCWSVTINNPTQTDEYNIQSARQKGWKVEGQLEKGKSGTPHYQLMVKTPQTRWSALKKQFPKAHIEVARNVQALEQYVNKEDTREGALPETSEFYPSLAKLWEMYYRYYIDRFCEGSHDPIDFYHIESEDKRLDVFDQFISESIRKGFHVEMMAVNPQTRAALKKYHNAILVRARNDIRRQTDRQTTEIPVLSDEYNDEEGSEEVSTTSPSGSPS